MYPFQLLEILNMDTKFGGPFLCRKVIVTYTEWTMSQGRKDGENSVNVHVGPWSYLHASF